MELSQKRAKVAVLYLKNSSNVKDERITSRGYVESQIINECINGVYCSESMHAVSRRMELKVIGMYAKWRKKSLEQMKVEGKFERDILSGEADQRTNRSFGGWNSRRCYCKDKERKRWKKKTIRKRKFFGNSIYIYIRLLWKKYSKRMKKLLKW